MGGLLRASSLSEKILLYKVGIFNYFSYGFLEGYIFVKLLKIV